MAGPAPSEAQFDVFVSYSHTDADVVGELVERLEADGFRVWFDVHQMERGHTTIGQLADGIARSAHMLACLSDAYIDRDYTAFELDTNQSFDPANRQNRTIPVIVKPLTKDIPTQIRAFTFGDLTDSERFPEEYERIAGMLRRPKAHEEAAVADEATLRAKCDAPFEHLAAEPHVALLELRVAAEALLRFLFRKMIGGSARLKTMEDLRNALLSSHRLPYPVQIAVQTLDSYGNYLLQDLSSQMGVSPDQIRPGLSALRYLADWIFAHYFEPSPSSDPWEALFARLPAGEAPGERLIPGTRFVATLPASRKLPWCACFPGRDTKWRQTVTIALYRAEGNDEGLLFQRVSALMRECGSSLLRPLDAGRVQDGPAVLCLYVVTEWAREATVEDFISRFGALPAKAVLEMGAATAAGLELLHGLSVPVVLGGFDAFSLLVDRQGKLKFDWAVSEGFARPERRPEPGADLEALRALLRKAAGVEDAAASAAEPALLQLLGRLADLSSPGEIQAACEDSLRLTGPYSLGLREVAESYFAGQPLPAGQRPLSGRASRKPMLSGFERICEIHCEFDAAWPVAGDRILAWQAAGGTFSLYEGDERVWQGEEHFQLRGAAVGKDATIACSGWKGEVLVLDRKCRPHLARLDGVIGDIAEAGGKWIAGSWRHGLWWVDQEGSAAPIAPGSAGGVYRLAATPTGDWFAVSSLDGIISVYSRGGRTAEMPSAGGRAVPVFCGRRLLVLTGDEHRLHTIELDGRLAASERPAGAGRRWLLPWPREGGCLLVDEFGSSWILEESGVIRPYAELGSLREVRAVPGREGRLLIRDCGGWKYWREGVTRRHWPQALSATFVHDGARIAVRTPDTVELWGEPD